MKTATFIKNLNGFTGDARLYELSHALGGSRHVVVSATNPYGMGPETYIFAADADGRVREYSELDGSFQGGLDHEKALRGAGYVMADSATARRRQLLRELAPALWTLLAALVCAGFAGWFAWARDWLLAVAMVFWALYLAFTALRMAGLVRIEAVDEDWPG